MITDILLHGPASYKEPVSITGLKKLNYFYGLNGTGKSTLSNYLASISEGNTGDAIFSECTYTLDSTSDNAPKILVYNSDFVDKNFHSVVQQNGIFTLDTTNIIAQTNIAKADNTIKEYQKAIKLAKTELERKTASYTERRNTIVQYLWDAEKLNRNNKSLAQCFKGSLRSKKFFESLQTYKSTDISLDKIPSQIKDIAEQLKDLDSSNLTTIDTHDEIIFSDIETIEAASIFSMKIVPSDETYMSALITRLGHSDWLKKGIEEYIGDADDCPFCGRHIADSLKEKIRGTVDETYKRHISECALYKEQLSTQYDRILDELKAIAEDDKLNSDIDFSSHFNHLKKAITQNRHNIETKCEKPSLSATLTDTVSLIKNINLRILKRNDDIETFNTKIKNIDETKLTLKSALWSLIKTKHQNKINEFEKFKAKNNAETNEIEQTIKNTQKQIKLEENIIIQNQSKTKNIDSAINNINTNLKAIGITGFSLEKQPDATNDSQQSELYRIARKGETNTTTVFTTLSEGEKTLISFLYFVELCLGKTESNNNAENVSNRIIVIDDPISSLSFNHIFEIGTLIKNTFINKKAERPYHQVFILTHHLYFFHELLGNYGISKDTNLFRITKSTHSNITPIIKEEVQNNYQSYWEVVKNAPTNNTLKSVLPNAMRNILEHFFSFIGKDYTDVIGSLDFESSSVAYRSFRRYIDRYSHADAPNLTDTNDIDVDKFLAYFREIFDKSGNLEHYQMYIPKRNRIM